METVNISEKLINSKGFEALLHDPFFVLLFIFCSVVILLAIKIVLFIGKKDQIFLENLTKQREKYTEELKVQKKDHMEILKITLSSFDTVIKEFKSSSEKIHEKTDEIYKTIYTNNDLLQKNTKILNRIGRALLKVMK